MPLLSADEIHQIVARASYVAINDYESELLRERAGLTVQQLAEQVTALVVTRGAQGAEIYAAGEVYRIPAAQPDGAPVDPMGCGDAFRARLALRHPSRAGLDHHRAAGQLAGRHQGDAARLPESRAGGRQLAAPIPRLVW
ncbi:PfkB family carbohydrate kinase [Paludibacterium denitrificans]|uniref:PfkB family carbohydrate kinase n=1 Tax=Paludibacterium denitrificans TaxID=2675226 RepID=UPI002477F31D|nr:PfkB family carbohydrate kinase [Paludibacterium denitrificans]